MGAVRRLDAGESPLSAARIPEDVFAAMRRANLARWPTGAEVDLDAAVDFHSDSGRWSFGLYGKNLLDEVKHGGDTQLPALLGPVPLGGTFSPLAKGIVYGADVTLNFGN